MQITFLGHAGFCVETSRAVVIMDPWLSPHGAFDSGWFQFPRNHHVAPFVYEKLATPGKERFLYISHEHNDHFDPEFLQSIPNKEFTFVVPHFERDALRVALAECGAKSLVTCRQEEEFPIPGGYLKFYLDDSGLNRDSGVLLRSEGETFLNLNDCKIFDDLQAILSEQGSITVFACQFSGATWHPTCYDYPREVYERISEQKMGSKFEVVARAIETLKPKFYIPSAGPACFLDPGLLRLNFERTNIFPHAPKFLRFLEERLPETNTKWSNAMPGDRLDTDLGQFLALAEERVDEGNYEPYLRNYASQYTEYFAKRQPAYSNEQVSQILAGLQTEIERKLSTFTLHERVNVPLYFSFSEPDGAMLRIDFPRRVVEVVGGIRETNYYSITAPAWQLARILERRLTWEEFALTFRMRLNREPDVYQTLIQGFLLMEPEDMNWFCTRLLEIEEKQKRIVIDAGGTRYSIDRYCPHQGADLSQGWLHEGRFWTCPRHRWQFALDKGGQCTSSDGSIHAICLEGEF